MSSKLDLRPLICGILLNLVWKTYGLSTKKSKKCLQLYKFIVIIKYIYYNVNKITNCLYKY